MGRKRGGALVSIANVARIHAVLIPSAFSLIVMAIWLPLEIREFELQGSRYRESYLETRRELLQKVVDQFARTAPSLVAEALASGNPDPTAIAKTRLIRLIGSVRYPNDGSAWAFATDGTMIVNPLFPRQSRPEWYASGGLFDARDPRLAGLVHGMVNLATTTGAGFLECPWGQTRKLCYVRLIPQWNWVVGAGVSLDDIDAAVAANQRSLRVSVAVQAAATAVMLVAALVLSWIGLRAFSRRISGSLGHFQSFFESAARDRRPIDAALVRYSELGRIADFANAMIASQRDADRRVEQSEDQLRQKQKMEAVGRVAGVVAHDFNNMLTAILGYSETLLSSESLDAGALQAAREIQKTARLAGTLTRQLLSFSRKQPSKLCAVNLNDLVFAMSSMLQQMLGEKIQLSTRLEPSLGPIRADPTQIQQVVINLAVNSRDAMPTGGHILIESENWTPSSPEQLARAGSHSAFVRLSLSDSGCGMDESVKKRLFEPFFTTKPPGKGTGLGLSIVYAVVTQAGGFLEVESSPGKGTTTRAYFPCNGNPPVGPSSSGGESEREPVKTGSDADPALLAPRDGYPLAFLG